MDEGRYTRAFFLFFFGGGGGYGGGLWGGRGAMAVGRNARVFCLFCFCKVD